MEYINNLIYYFTKHVVVRYVISGSLAGLTTILVLYILNGFLGWYYLLSSVLAYLSGFVISFSLQKFWTFRSHGEATSKQLFMYLGSSLFGLVLNTMLMYIFVEHLFVSLPVVLKFRVLISEFVVGLLVACVTFFISRNIIFKYKKPSL